MSSEIMRIIHLAKTFFSFLLDYYYFLLCYFWVIRPQRKFHFSQQLCSSVLFDSCIFFNPTEQELNMPFRSCSSFFFKSFPCMFYTNDASCFMDVLNKLGYRDTCYAVHVNRVKFNFRKLVQSVPLMRGFIWQILN